MKKKRLLNILVVLLPFFIADINGQEITVSPEETTTLAVEPTTLYPPEGSTCTKNGRLPKLWLVSDNRCCSCKRRQVRCFDFQCPEAPSNTTGCSSRTICDCTRWDCDSSEEDNSLETNSREDSRERPFPGRGRGPGGRRFGRPSNTPGRRGPSFQGRFGGRGRGRGRFSGRTQMMMSDRLYFPLDEGENEVLQTEDCAEMFKESFLKGALCMMGI
ncbi:uncharacterized protein [Palaemon carinicauda]|uniref:uncharacterized protein n=1 Tax=Palaemon carinicauda TaxID=392227 RepID=UPI0035B586B3